MKYGLTISELESIINVFRDKPKVEKAALFGSRAKNSYREGSDIDIALFGETLTFDDMLEMNIRLEELDILQKIDIVHFETIDNPDFIDHIQRIGITIYSKGNKHADEK